MEAEIEVKILDINVEEVTKKIEEIGAKKIGERLQKRLIWKHDRNQRKLSI